MHTDADTNAHRCSHRCLQAVELSFSWFNRLEVQCPGPVGPIASGIWFLVCNGTMSPYTLLLERSLESLQGANGIPKA